LRTLPGLLLAAGWALGGAGIATGAILQVPADFPSIQGALDAALPGDTVRVATGVYHEKVRFPRSGNATAGPITLAAAAGASPVLDGTGVAGDDMVLIESRSFVELAGFEIRNHRGVTDGSGVRIVGSGSHLVIRNNRIHDVRGTDAMGITVYGTGSEPISDLAILDNEIFDCEPAPSEALAINGNVAGFEVSRNWVHDVNNIGIVMIGGERDIQPDPALVARGGAVRDNRVERARSSYGGGFGAGIYVDGGRDITIERNVVTRSDLGIEVGAENAGIVATGIVVRDNVLFSNDKACLVFGGYAPEAGRVRASTFRHNTCYGNDTLGSGFGELWIQLADGNLVENNVFAATQDRLVLADDAFADNRLDYNLFFAPAGAAAGRFRWRGADYEGFAAYRAGSGQDLHSAFADPRLADPAAGDVHLLAASPAVDASNPTLLPAPGETDFEGGPRLVGAAVDVGADERLAPAPCVPTIHTLCLDGGRFAVSASWATASGSGAGSGVPLTADSGYFWFFSPQNVEAVVKVLDACSFNGRHWVFAAGLTDVEVELVVTDSSNGARRAYRNPRGRPFQPLQDTGAFATCP
jgi:hypothetical protein